MPRVYSYSRFNVIYGEDEGGGIFGTAGNDYMFGRGGNDLMLGGFGNDYLSGGAGTDYLNGGDGNDRLVGGAGDDIMIGGNGNDRLYMDDGDTGTGGTGADIFIFNARDAGTITITDFDAAEGDSLRLRTNKDDDWTLVEGATNTAIHFESGAVVELYGVTSAEIYDDPGLFGL